MKLKNEKKNTSLAAVVHNMLSCHMPAIALAPHNTRLVQVLGALCPAQPAAHAIEKATAEGLSAWAPLPTLEMRLGLQTPGFARTPAC